MAEAMQGLRQLADVLNVETARLSGDPKRLQLALGESQSRKLQEADNLINAEIDKLNIPETQKVLLKAIDTKSKADYILGGEKRRIVQQGGINYYADTGERVLPGVVSEEEDDSTEFERTSNRYLELSNKPTLDASEAREKVVLETKIFGKASPIPVFDAQGRPVTSVSSVEYIKNPNILKELEKEGYFTVGEKPSGGFKGRLTTNQQLQSNWLDTNKQLNTINDLANIIFENKDAFTIAGGLASLVNNAKYQVQSAGRLSALSNYQKNNPEGFKKLDNLLDNKYGDKLDKISGDRAVAKSIFLKLAYGTAKEIDPSGRLSDNDVKIAMEIIGQLGANYKSNLKVLENLHNTTIRDYDNFYNQKFREIEDQEKKEEAEQNYKNLPKFLGGLQWDQTTDSKKTTDMTDDELLEFYK